ncbi:MAG: transglycosylase domain-containing protein [Kiritimatiellae bacterium]|nr:transglycosylase domain-containing protein [Kiritimatiellia bacterium]
MEESRAEQYTDAPRRAAPRRRRRRRSALGTFALGVLKLLVTVLAIGVLTAGMFYRTFMKYVDTVLEPEMDVDLSAYTLKQSSTIYYQDKATGEWLELTKLHGDENRTLVDYSQIPDHVVKALVSIEDQRFYEHEGVDWKSTARSVYDTLTGNNARGASTITQQVVKNVTGENQVTIRRKILEIFRALRLHEKYTEEEILETYFNLVYFGHKAYGIEAAAETYFGKHVEELTVAEGAAIVGITQYPWQYDPLRNDKTRAANRSRQLDVLYKMNEQGWLSDPDYEAAKAEKMVFVGDEDYVDTHSDETESAANTQLDSFFVEQVYRDVVKAFVEMGYGERAAAQMIYNGGYQIYATVDMDIQNYVESVYADRGNFDYPSKSGQQLQSGMTVIDNATGNIVAIGGRVGERKGALEWSYAANNTQCGSAIKPLSVYAPALEAGVVTAASVIDDYPVMELNGSAWPVNAYRGYRGLSTIQFALRQSSNTCAVRTLMKLGMSTSYAFLQDKLGFTTLTEDDLVKVGNLALGGGAVNTIEMAAGYATFANNGVYTEPRTFTQVLDSNGFLFLDNTQETHVAMKESTVYTMNELLKSVMKSGGTGTAAAFSGMTQAGKTGTTNEKKDRYFCGYTPYYTAAVWSGYDTPEKILPESVNPSALAWKMVMSKIHENLPDKDFPTTSDGMVRVTVCNKTGLLAGSGCGSTRSVLVPGNYAPALTCDGHDSVLFCTESGLPANMNCPDDTLERHALVDLSAPNVQQGFGYTRQLLHKPTSSRYEIYAGMVEAGLLDAIPAEEPIFVDDSAYVLSDVEAMGLCSVHREAPPAEEEPPADGTEPENPDGTGETTEPVNPTDTQTPPPEEETTPPVEEPTPTEPETEQPVVNPEPVQDPNSWFENF